MKQSLMASKLRILAEEGDDRSRMRRGLGRSCVAKEIVVLDAGS